MAPESKVTLKSSDNVLFEVNEPVALQSEIIKTIVEDVGTARAIPLPNVSSKILSKVIKYCNYHVEAQTLVFTKGDIKSWDQEFVKVDLPTLFHLIRAANYLNIYSLLDLTCQTLADNVKEKTIEEIRKIFKIIPEEEDVRFEN